MAAGRMTRSAATAALTAWALLTAEAALAQNPQALFPPNVILPNNNSLPIGEVGGLGGNAYTARASESLSANSISPPGRIDSSFDPVTVRGKADQA